MSHDYDIPIVRRTISIRSPRGVLLLNPTLPIVVAILAVSVVFTIWPEALNHSPIGFERRGIVHHIWHYALLAGATSALVGMFGTFPRRLQLELFGMIVLVGALTVNLIATIDESIDPVGEAPSGLAMAIRTGVIFVLIMRVYVLSAFPAVTVPVRGKRA